MLGLIFYQASYSIEFFKEEHTCQKAALNEREPCDWNLTKGIFSLSLEKNLACTVSYLKGTVGR